jgi:hypothetical protein
MRPATLKLISSGPKYFKGMKSTTVSLLLLVMLVPVLAFSQKREHFTTFKGNKVYIVYLGNKEFDSALKKACTDNWTATPIAGFIEEKALKNLIDDTANSFMVPRIWVRHYNDGSYPQAMAGLHLINGGLRRYERYNYDLHKVKWVDFDLIGYESKIERAKYRLALVVAELNESVLGDRLKHRNPPALKNKILLINKNLVEKIGKERPPILKEALTAYKYKYEIADEERITSLINARDSSYALFVPIVHDRSVEVNIYDLSTYHILWVLDTYKGLKRRWPWVREVVIEKLNSDIH